MSLINLTGSRVSRRTFIKGAAALYAASQLPAVSWGRVLGSNDRINVAVIGTGGQGTWHVQNFMALSEPENVRCIKVCDVYRRRLNNSVSLIQGAEASGTMEYERILDDKDVNAVLIATPDHWHTKMAIEAMEAGKDVYCEKPLSLTIEQAIQCRDAVKRTGRVLQVGPQGTSEDRWWKAREAIGEGRIGKVVWSQAGYCRNSRGGQFNWAIDPDAGPQSPPQSDGYVDWDRWLGWKYGLAEHIPWNADHFFRFRKYWAYNGGVATDLLYHKLAPTLIAIAGPDGEYPRRVVASGGKYLEKDERDIPDTFMMMIDYPSEFTVHLVSVMTNDNTPPETIRGQYGTMEAAPGGWRVTEQSTWWPEFRKANMDRVASQMVKNEKGEEKPEPGAGGAKFDLAAGARRGHTENFLDAIRGTSKPHCPITLGCATMVAIKMGVESYRTGKAMGWDPKTEKASAI